MHQALLHLLLKISESVSRLESLLLITSPNDDNPVSPKPSGARLPDRVLGVEDEVIDDGSVAAILHHY